MDFKDYYATLGVARDATADDIKKAFRKVGRSYNPDVSKEADAEARMKEINEAHAVLSDPEKRAAYDALGQGYRPGSDFSPPPNWDAGFEFSGAQAGADAAGFSDFFSELFGRMGRGGPRGQGQGFDARGEDHHAKVLVDVEDVWRGATRQISLRSPGMDEHGRLVVRERTLSVQIPRGLREGQIMRLAGQGGAGLGQGKAGDLLLEVHFREHPRFRVEGSDLYMTLPVTPWEAALGGVVEVTLPDGSAIKVRIPPGAQSGRTLRVRGKGIPSQLPGDLHLALEVVLPPASSPRARDLYETMARELAFDPRQAKE